MNAELEAMIQSHLRARIRCAGQVMQILVTSLRDLPVPQAQFDDVVECVLLAVLGPDSPGRTPGA